MHRRLDELLSIYVIFRTPLLDDGVLTSYLARLLVNVEAFAFGTGSSSEQEHKPPKELIYSSTIKDNNRPSIIRHGRGTDAHTYVIWKVEVFICESKDYAHIIHSC